MQDPDSNTNPTFVSYLIAEPTRICYRNCFNDFSTFSYVTHTLADGDPCIFHLQLFGWLSLYASDDMKV